jgi:hypothetical protein
MSKGGIGQGKETKNLNEVICSLYRNEYRNFKLARATMGSRLGRSEEDWKRQINWSCNTYMHRNNRRNLPVFVSLSQTIKNIISLILQNLRTYSAGGPGVGKGVGG